ncbi:uncharacterized protein EAF02_006545 [Botrytis sinoallii]|uniref:uncharacterized protein n=1 Tax=Botrytis sinoallii TaxID=1463999 RepID=UPI001900BF34|nr:uncharacterized protein EAF02_006545 [Botrytis sinoallii]KAF7881857.1 hypothetical protein EAF02_006545 [Botrytis sinoallii]
MSSSSSSQVAEPKASPCFNYQAPISNNTGRKDGYLILPNFNTSTGPINQKLAIIKNSECPELLKVAGHTSKAEDEAACCHEMFLNQPYYVASGPKDKDPVFTAQFFGESDVKNITLAYEAMKEAREIAHRKSADPNSRNDVSEFEQRMIGGSKKKILQRRAYVQGFTITQQQDAICAAQLNAAIIENAESTGRLNQLIAIAAGNLLANCVPKEVLARLAKQAESAVPITFGHEDNKFFSTVQYNYSGVEIASLEMSLGNFGALHIDGHDDSAMWTVLLVLSNIPESYWPGRTFVSSLRIYATMGPMTALVFKAVHPHISLGPIPMGESKRLRYAYLPEKTHIMDSVLYNQSRLVAVCYPKGTVMRETPALLRRSTPKILQTIKGVRSSLPEAHPIAIAAFGTLRNQMEFLARLEAHDKVKMNRINPSLKMPTADLFVQLWSWEENGVTMTPRVSRTQAVLDSDGETKEWYEDYSKKCDAILSMRWFDGNKKTETNWVSTENVGSTFAHLDPLASTAAKPLEEFNKWAKKTNNLPTIKQNYGKLPYQCPNCELRFSTKQRVKLHHNLAHMYTYEWQMPQPSVDPAHQERNSEFEGEGEEQLAEEAGLEDEEYPREEGSIVKKRKR